MVNPIDYYGDITLHGGELKDVAIEVITTEDLPTTNLVKGRIVLYKGAINYYDGSNWIVLGSSADVTALDGRVDTLETKMGTAEGNITTLQGDVSDLKGKVFDKANIVTSIATSIDATSDEKVPSEKAVKSAINTAISGAYKYAGNVANKTELESAEKVNGAIYNVTATFTTDEGVTFKEGTNIVYDSASARWEMLSGIIDTSIFQLVGNLQDSLAEDVTRTKYPTVTAVNTGLELKADKADTYTKKEVDDALKNKVNALAEGSKPTADTYVKVTINGDGLVTAGQKQIAVADISDFATEVAKVEVATARSLKTAQNFSISGGATATAVPFDGTGAVELVVTEIAGGKVKGEIPVGSVPEIGISKITDFANEVKGVIRPQFVDVALTSATNDGNKYTITTAGRAYGVMVLHNGVQVFVSTTVTDGNIVLDFNSAITASEFTVSYIQKF